jgi:uncharacterized membrane protein
MHTIKALFEQAITTGYRSTVLNPLNWLISILTTGGICSYHFGVPIWVTTTFFGFDIMAIIIYLFAYIYLMFKDKDALRSEKYSIQKLAIEKGIYGDSVHGILTNDEILSLQLPQVKSQQNKEGNQ